MTFRVKLIYRPIGKFCYSNGMEATPIRILNAAEQRIRTAGYHGFSFREIAADVGIKSSSVHHYFPTKESLGVAVARRYTDRFFAALPAEPLEPQTALRKAFLRAIESDGRVCLCGALASGAGSLPPSIAAEARRFFEESLRYLSERTDQRGTARHNWATQVLAQLEGAMLVAVALGDRAAFARATQTFPELQRRRVRA